MSTHARFLPTDHRAYAWVAALATVIMLLRAGSTVRTFNHTTDEPAHLAAAVGIYEARKNLYMVEHPPLQRLVVGLPLVWAGAELPAARGLSQVQSRYASNQAGEQVLLHGKLPYWRILTIARLANLIFAALGMVFLYLLARWLANGLVAAAAVTFFSLDPTLLAHAPLATTDVPAAAGFLAATYFGLRFLIHPTRGRAGLAGMALGLACAIKFSCILLLPALGVLVLARSVRDALVRPREGGASGPASAWAAFFRRWPRAGHLAAVAVVAFLALWATYLFDVGRLDDQDLFHDERTWNRLPAWIKQAPVPMPSLILGQGFLAALGRHGFPSYLNGRVSAQGDWYYFLETLAIKSPLGLLLALAAGVGALAIARRTGRHGWRVAAILLPASILLLVSSMGKLQIGIRHLIPLLPFLYLFAAFALQQRGRQVVLGACIALAAVEAAAVHPDYLAFFNRLVGGPAAGHKYLGDSNLDWGQDVDRLAKYLRSPAAAGRPYTLRLSGSIVRALVSELGLDPAALDRDRPRRGLLAVSSDVLTRVHNSRWQPDGSFALGPDYGWLRNYALVARVGRTIAVYDLDRPSDPTNNPPDAAATVP